MSRPLPRLASAADTLTAALAVAGTLIAFTSGIEVRIGVVHLSMRSAWRLYLWALVVIAIRHWFVRHPTILDWISRGARGLADARQWLVPQPATREWWAQGVRGSLPVDERSLFGEALTWPQRAGRLALLVLGFSLLGIAFTWPQARRLDSVPDIGDPLFSIWRLAWVSRQIIRDPLHLFDGNIFYPERLTLTYSDSIIVPALISAPLFWIGVHPVAIYNLLMISGFVLSGITMFLLVRALTGRIDAAIIAGALFALYPYRYEHYSHLELQMTMWMPLCLWALHRAIARGRLRDGLTTGLTFALQTLSSLYYGLFLALYLLPVGIALWLARGRPLRPLVNLAAGAALASVLVAPVIYAYTENQAMVGDRGVSSIQFYSAEGADYLKPHGRNLIYGRWSEGGYPERQLFPRIMPVVLSAAALWPPLSAVRIGYALALVVAIDGSLGFNGGYYSFLYAHVSPYRGLRVPARFSVLVGLTLSLLSGYGALRILARWPGQRVILTGVMFGLIMVEALPRMPLMTVWKNPPPIYASIADQPNAVLAEFPMPTSWPESWIDTRYLYFSTFHWHPIVNGNSGYAPKSYEALIDCEQGFPSESAIDCLRRHGVDYVAIHGAFMEPVKFQRVVATLDGRRDMPLVTAVAWEGSESRLYRLRRP